LAGYLVEHARAVFDLMGADPGLTTPAGCWTGSAIPTWRSSPAATPIALPPEGRFAKAAELDPALALLEEHGWLRRVDADSNRPKGGRPPSPRYLVNPCTRRQNLHNRQNLIRRLVLSVL
jgi:hypothetical protein